ncbi:MAG: DMT family transporter [Pseudomonadota bacterium]
MTPYVKGLLLTLAGVVLMSPDAVLIRLINVDAWALLIWRGGLMALAMLALLAIAFRGNIRRGFRGFGLGGLIASFALCFGNIGFVTAMTEEKVALVLVVFATVPLFGALIGWGGYGEKIPARTWIAIPAAMAGLAVAAQASLQTGVVFPLAMALCGTLMLATFLTILRHEPGVNNYAATALGSAFAAIVALGFADPGVIAGSSDKLAFTVLLCLFVLPAAMAFFSAGPRYISSADVGLVLLLETVLGPLWVWLVIAEAPALSTLFGGAIVIATLIAHSIAALRAQRPQISRPRTPDKAIRPAARPS